MRTRLLSAAAAAVASVGFAAEPPLYLPGGPAKPADAPVLLPSAPPPAPKDDCPHCLTGGSTGLRPGIDCLPDPAAVARRPRLYGSVEYVLFWFDDRTPPALVATTPPNILGQPLGSPGINVLYGGDRTDFGGFDAVRATVGYWLDDRQSVGVEATGFLTEQQAELFAASTSAAVPSPVALAGVVPTIAGPFALPFPGPNAGVTIAEKSRLWGAEANGVVNASRSCRGRLDLLGGFRYLDLDESLDATSTFELPFFTGPTVFSTVDEFETRTQFFGGQLGARATYGLGRVALSATAKLGLGASHLVVDRRGSSAVTPGGSFTGGSLIQPGNVGRDTTDKFAVLPEGILQVGYRVTERLDVSVGYSVLYLTSAARAADQVNDGFAPKVGIDSTDFVAQGISFGLGYRY